MANLDFLTGPQDAYEVDRSLLQKLGLRVNGYGREWTKLGGVQVAGAHVDAEVRALPAQFFRFTVKRPNHEPRALSTGSGTFREYWPAVVAVARGTSLEDAKRQHGVQPEMMTEDRA